MYKTVKVKMIHLKYMTPNKRVINIHFKYTAIMQYKLSLLTAFQIHSIDRILKSFVDYGQI